MVEKRGIIRVLEATIAILIILAALIIFNYHNQPTQEQNLGTLIRPVLDSIAHNITLRGDVISYNTSKKPSDLNNAKILAVLREYINSKITNHFLSYKIEICEAGAICALEPYPSGISGGVYANTRIISTTLSAKIFNPKQVKLFIWRKVSQ